MWAKSLLLAAMIAGSAVAAASPAEVTRVQYVQPFSLIPVQDRRGHEIRSLREVVDELRSRYGGELINARLEDGPSPFYVVRWRMPNGDVRDFRVNAAR